MASSDKVYPGNIGRYLALREKREALESDLETLEEPSPLLEQRLAFATISEELAGLAYILDGIRYSTRKS